MGTGGSDTGGRGAARVPQAAGLSPPGSRSREAGQRLITADALRIAACRPGHDARRPKGQGDPQQWQTTSVTRAASRTSRVARVIRARAIRVARIRARERRAVATTETSRAARGPAG